MAKVTISRLFEVSKYMTTEAGKELKDALTYISEFVEVVTRNLRNGLTYADNFNVSIRTISVRPDTEQVILTNEERRRVKEVRVRRVSDDTYYILSNFGWKYNSEGSVLVQADFLDSTGASPSATTDVSIELIVFFG